MPQERLTPEKEQELLTELRNIVTAARKSLDWDPYISVEKLTQMTGRAEEIHEIFEKERQAILAEFSLKD